MELTNIYNTFLNQKTSAVVTTLEQEYDINIMGLKLELSFFPTYLEENCHGWKAYNCMVDDVHIDFQFYFIVNETTNELLELEVLALDTKKVS